MKESYWLGGSIGGFVVFLWTIISWGSIYSPQLMQFENEAAVTAAIAANAPESGVYLLPNTRGVRDLSPEQAKERLATVNKQWSEGPTAVVVVRAKGMPSVAPAIISLAITLPIAGLLIAWLLSKTSDLGYWGKVAFIVATAFTAGVLVHVPEWGLWGVPQSFTYSGFFDLVAGWFFGGLVMAKLCK